MVTNRSQWAFWVGLDDGEWLKVENPDLRIGAWQRVTGVYCSQRRCARIFVDGKLTGPRAELAKPNAAFKPNTCRPMRIGAGASEGKAKFLFQGGVQQIRIYAAALCEPLLDEGIIDEPSLKKQRC